MQATLNTVHNMEHAATPGTVLELRQATKDYGKVRALDAVSIGINRGECVALLGRNGAGKTTAVGLLLGLDRPDSGQALMFGADPFALQNRVRTGTMMQVTGMPDTLTVQEHLEGFASYYPAPLGVAQILASTGLSGLEKRLYGKLSGGQKQRLHLAISLVGDPEILFLDEPTTGLDVNTRKALWQLVREFRDRNRTVVLTTHYLEEADALADRIVVLNHGRVVAEGTPDQIRASTAGKRIRAVTGFRVEEARELPGVARAVRDGDTLELHVTEAETATRALLQRDAQLRDLEVTTIGLDEAFISLTGDAREVPS